MGVVDISGCHHIRLTVTDIARSRAFYTEVLGFQVIAESPGDPSDPAVRADQNQLYGGIVMLAGSLVIGLRPVAPAEDRFGPDRVGLDHLSFNVASRSALADAAKGFADRGITHGEITDLAAFGIAVLSFEDPDGVQLELTAPLSS
jgi:catechol 2,3-dioxygenase-like lactoylglutathione lyase family enzyme